MLFPQISEYMQQNSDSRLIDEICVSVVIPYSPEHTPSEMLEEAKQSVKRQSVPTEIIVVEDTEQRGPAWARNRGLDRAKTRFVAFLDADDKWYPGKLRHQLNAMNQYEAGLCVEGECESDSIKIDLDVFIRELLFGSFSSLTSSIVIDTSYASIRFREDLARLEDHLFITEMAVHSGVCLVDGPLTEINKHEEGLSARGTPEQMYNSRLKVAEYLSEYSPTKKYVNKIKQLAYYGLGRQRQMRGNYLVSVPPLVQSLRYGIAIKPIGALALTPWYIIKDTISK